MVIPSHDASLFGFPVSCAPEVVFLGLERLDLYKSSSVLNCVSFSLIGAVRVGLSFGKEKEYQGLSPQLSRGACSVQKSSHR